MKRTRYILLLTAMAALMAGCVKHEMSTFNFDARIEQLDNGEAKTQLVGEKWIYWVEFDQISINSNTSGNDAPKEGILLNHAGTGENYPEYNGVFQSTLEWNSEYFCALYPYRTNNVITNTNGDKHFETVKIDLPPTQKYANDTSFDHNVMPMVAWYGGTPTGEPYTSPNLDFHSLGGIVRMHIFNSSSSQTIESVTITSNGRDNKQLKGLFSVDNLETYDPHVTSLSNAEEDRTITISMPSGGISFSGNKLLTFYLVLPATKGVDDSTVYHLTMIINTDNGKHCSRNFTVPVRRNGITNMRALGVTGWTTSGTGGSTAIGLSGVGTEARPYKIYNADDLNIVRRAFNSSTPIINNTAVTEDTWFRIMSSFELTDGNWESGINNFKGHMSFYGTNSTEPGITNNSLSPLFESITANSTVDGITVRCNLDRYRPATYSPFCITNNGNIINCHIASAGSNGLSVEVGQDDGGLAGICVTNNEGALIQGCGCTAKMACTNQRVAGICLLNRGTIKECFAASPMDVTAAKRASGICDTNANNLTSVIEDCYFAARISNSTIPWSGIASVNRATIRHCYASETAMVLTTSSAAGIVGNNMAGTVDYCWSEAMLQGRYLGMIAATVSGGKLINCFCNNKLAMMTLIANAGAHYSGGLVGTFTGGRIENCFIYMNHTNMLDNTGTIGGFAGILNGTGTISNCYVFETTSPTHTFYGAKSNDDETVLTNCYLVDGTQTGLTSFTTTQLESLEGTLNGTVPTGGKNWQGASNSTNTPPSLEPYVVSTKKNRR